MSKILNKALTPFGLKLSKINQKKYINDQVSMVGNKKKPIIFDVGAHKGETLIEYKKHFPDSLIYCFEPFEDSFNELTLLRKNYNNVIVNNIAISSEVGEKKLFINKDTSANSLLPLVKANTKYSGQNSDIDDVIVKTTTIDIFCSKNNISDIDILKLDIEGNELRALHGTSELLNKRAIGLIFTEINFLEFRTNYTLFHDICSYLENFHYSLFNIYDIKNAPDGQIRWGNAIFQRKELKK